MCDTLLELRAGMSRWAAGFDAALLSAAQAALAVEAATAIERMAATAKATAAARVAQTRAWRAPASARPPPIWPGRRAAPWARHLRPSLPASG